MSRKTSNEQVISSKDIQQFSKNTSKAYFDPKDLKREECRS